MSTIKPSIFDTVAREKFAQEHKVPAFRHKQIIHNSIKNAIIDFEQMTDLPKELRTLLADNFVVSSLEVEETLECEETTKFLFKMQDGKVCETVIMYHHHVDEESGDRYLNRMTLCISSQVGCPVGCIFCVTGKLGFGKNMDFPEIMSQILYANAYLKDKFGKKEDGTLYSIRNVVFMGMGEPFLNYENVKKMCEYLIDNRYFGLSKKRVTISTSGVVPPILKLVEDKIDVALALSLHAPNQTLREELIPTIAKRFKLPELMKAIDTYTKASGNKVFYEYIMIKDKTDSDELAHQTGKLLRGKPAHLNLIPYNPNPAIDDLEESDMVRIRAFQAIIMTYDIPCTVRDTMGREVGSACGQLGYEKIGGKIVRKKVAA